MLADLLIAIWISVSGHSRQFRSPGQASLGRQAALGVVLGSQREGLCSPSSPLAPSPPDSKRVQGEGRGRHAALHPDCGAGRPHAHACLGGAAEGSAEVTLAGSQLRRVNRVSRRGSASSSPTPVALASKANRAPAQEHGTARARPRGQVLRPPAARARRAGGRGAGGLGRAGPGRGRPAGAGRCTHSPGRAGPGRAPLAPAPRRLPARRAASSALPVTGAPRCCLLSQ